MTIELTEKKLKLVGELAVFHERSGMQPAAARIIALLIVSDEPELTFEEIYETLNMSKSAASNALNFLLNTERIEYVTRLGERKRYFKVKLKNIKESITRFLSGMDTFNNVLKRILDQRPVGTREFNNNLEELTRFQDFLQQELPLLIQKWESGNK
jgi:DNA-binding transcriptional regulator GbsR (MarR family)